MVDSIVEADEVRFTAPLSKELLRRLVRLVRKGERLVEGVEVVVEHK